MNPTAPNYEWQPLRLLRSNFLSNVDALATRLPALADDLRGLAPAGDFYLSTNTGRLALAVHRDERTHVFDNPVPPLVAAQVTKQAFPAGQYTAPAMVVGLDQGWLWNALYALPSNVPGLPGHRPPVYLLCRDVERLWAVMHVQSWQTLLADPRALLFVGADAVEQARRHMLANVAVPWPKFSLNIDASLWPAGVNLDALLADVSGSVSDTLAGSRAALASVDTPDVPPAVAARIRAGEPLRVMGLTSRYTTFLQHSMRDWLGAFERMGHRTKLVIEQADHEVLNNVSYTEASRDFRPDLVLIIDHYRAEIDGLPRNVPSVMWVQDNLPNIFSPKAGAAQGPLDFCVGFGRYHLASKYGYPIDQFCPSTPGTDETRFGLDPVDPALMAAHACDVSYVGHASVPADVLVREEIAKATSPAIARLLDDTFARMVGHYDVGGEVMCPNWIRRAIDDSCASLRLTVDDPSMAALIEFFTQRVNNALYRHRTLQWVADLGVDLRLYGRGWEQHPTLGRYARGIADNKTQLKAIYHASRINLQVTPFSAVHQRLLDGLLAGGFFLIRRGRGDNVGLLHRTLWDWCQRRGISDDAQLTAAFDDSIRPVVDRINWLEGFRGIPRTFPLFDTCRTHAGTQFLIAADSVWPDHYPQVAFDNAGQLRDLVARYLPDADARREVAMSMRARVVDNCTYTAISRRLLDLIADRIERQQQETDTPVMRGAA